MYCQNCGNLIYEGEKTCSKCGAPIKAKPVRSGNTSMLPKWGLGRTIIGAFSLICSLLILFQSLAVGFGNILQNNNEASGSFGVMCALMYFTAGLVGILTRKTEKAGGPIACLILYWIIFFFSRIGSGSYADLRVWGVLAYIFGTVFLISVCHTKKQYIIGVVIAAVYLIMGLA